VAKGSRTKKKHQKKKKKKKKKNLELRSLGRGQLPASMICKE